jgi:hypothetical protein
LPIVERALELGSIHSHGSLPLPDQGMESASNR